MAKCTTITRVTIFVLFVIIFYFAISSIFTLSHVHLQARNNIKWNPERCLEVVKVLTGRQVKFLKAAEIDKLSLVQK
jgi:hypothetical protein